MSAEIACDESGYEGERLIHTTTDTFAHASVHLDPEVAAGVVRELRARIRSPAVEYKANHLLREKHRAVLRWFLGPDGPLPGRAAVFLIDKAYFVVDRLGRPDLHRVGQAHPDRDGWDAFLVAANELMRAKADDPVPAFVAATARLADPPGPPGRPGALGRPGPPGWFAAAMRELAAGAVPLRERLLGEAVPPMDPLFPALVGTVDRWAAASGGAVTIVHDRQTTLPARRVAQLRAATGGRLAELRLVNSATDARVQIADFLAGITTRHVTTPGEIATLLDPYIDPGSIRSRDG